MPTAERTAEKRPHQGLPEASFQPGLNGNGTGPFEVSHPDRTQEVNKKDTITHRTFCGLGEFGHIHHSDGANDRIQALSESYSWSAAIEDTDIPLPPITASIDGRLTTRPSTDRFRILLANPDKKTSKILSVDDPSQIGDIRRDAYVSENRTASWLGVDDETVAVVLSSVPVKHPNTDGRRVVETLEEQGLAVAATMVYLPGSRSEPWSVAVDTSDSTNKTVDLFSPDTDNYYSVKLPKALNLPEKRRRIDPSVRSHEDGKKYPISRDEHPFDPNTTDPETYPPYRLLKSRLLNGEQFTPKQWGLAVFAAQQAHLLGLIEEEYGNLMIPDDVSEPVQSRFDNLIAQPGESSNLICLNGQGPDSIEVEVGRLKTLQDIFTEYAINPDALVTTEDVDPECSNRAKRRNAFRLAVFAQEASIINS